MVIATGGGNDIKLVLTKKLPERRSFIFGRLKDKLILPDEWEQHWEAHSKELETLMCDAPFSTNGDE